MKRVKFMLLLLAANIALMVHAKEVYLRNTYGETILYAVNSETEKKLGNGAEISLGDSARITSFSIRTNRWVARPLNLKQYITDVNNFEKYQELKNKRPVIIIKPSEDNQWKIGMDWE